MIAFVFQWTDSDRLTASKEPFWLENIDTSDDKFLKYEVCICERHIF